MTIDSLREFGSRIAKPFRRARFEAEMNDELQFHVEMQTEQLVRSGMSHEEARRRALIEFGGLDQTRENCRNAVGIRLMSEFVNDLRSGVPVRSSPQTCRQSARESHPPKGDRADRRKSPWSPFGAKAWLRSIRNSHLLWHFQC